MGKRELKVPKRVAGLKLPKTIRQSANNLTRHFENPLGRELIAEAFVALAGALVGSRYVREATVDAGRQAKSAAEGIAEPSSAIVSAGVSALGSGVESLLRNKKGKPKKKRGKKNGAESFSAH